MLLNQDAATFRKADCGVDAFGVWVLNPDCHPVPFDLHGLGRIIAHGVKVGSVLRTPVNAPLQQLYMARGKEEPGGEGKHHG
jgi:hypothetical protein